jgi:hypothetical protein
VPATPTDELNDKDSLLQQLPLAAAPVDALQLPQVDIPVLTQPDIALPTVPAVPVYEFQLPNVQSDLQSLAGQLLNKLGILPQAPFLLCASCLSSSRIAESCSSSLEEEAVDCWWTWDLRFIMSICSHQVNQSREIIIKSHSRPRVIMQSRCQKQYFNRNYPFGAGAASSDASGGLWSAHCAVAAAALPVR